MIIYYCAVSLYDHVLLCIGIAVYSPGKISHNIHPFYDEDMLCVIYLQLLCICRLLSWRKRNQYCLHRDANDIFCVFSCCNQLKKISIQSHHSHFYTLHFFTQCFVMIRKHIFPCFSRKSLAHLDAHLANTPTNQFFKTSVGLLLWKWLGAIIPLR